MQTKGDDVIDAALRVERIKERINRAEYRVDADAVAEEIVRRLVRHPAPERCWYPCSATSRPSRVKRAPGDAGGEGRTSPTQVTSAAASIAARAPGGTHTHSS
jgi:hypothetical protein